MYCRKIQDLFCAGTIPIESGIYSGVARSKSAYGIYCCCCFEKNLLEHECISVAHRLNSVLASFKSPREKLS